MKISAHVAKNLSANQFKKNGMQPIPIPYDRQERLKDKDNEDVSVFRIRTNPTDKDSQTYDMKVLTFHTGTVEEFLLWKKDLNKVLVGQNVLSAPDKFAMTRRLLDGDALLRHSILKHRRAVKRLTPTILYACKLCQPMSFQRMHWPFNDNGFTDTCTRG
jgi:hypothetical protein